MSDGFTDSSQHSGIREKTERDALGSEFFTLYMSIMDPRPNVSTYRILGKEVIYEERRGHLLLGERPWLRLVTRLPVTQAFPPG